MNDVPKIMNTVNTEDFSISRSGEIVPKQEPEILSIEDGKKYLVSTDNYFRAPDGENYCAAWGTCYLKKIDQVLGFTPIRPSTNWFLKVGSGDHYIIIAGCQIHYVMRSECPPIIKPGTYISKETGKEHPENCIYLAE